MGCIGFRRRLSQAEAEAARREERGARRALQARRPGDARPRARLVPLAPSALAEPARRVDDAAVLQVRARRPGVRVAVRAVSTFMLTGTSNAVNITDGLDGLAAGLSAIAFGDVRDLRLHHRPRRYEPVSADLLSPRLRRAHGLLPGDGRRAASAFSGTTRIRPQVFMGDTGSLALGGALGAVAILLKSEFLLAFVGAVFVAEMMSVILQRFVFKYRRTRYGARVRAGASRLSPRAAASSLRGEGLEGAAGRRALLDHRHPLRVPRTEHAQAALSMRSIARPKRCPRSGRAARSRRRSRAQRRRRGAAARARGRATSTRPTLGRWHAASTAAHRAARCGRRCDAARTISRASRAARSSSRARACRPTRRRSPPRATPACRSSSEIEIGAPFLPRLRYIAVTGTNGKTTTTALIGHLLKALGTTRVDGRQHRHAADRDRAARRPPGVGRARGVVVPAARHAEHRAGRRRADEPLGRITSTGTTASRSTTRDKALLFRNASERSTWVTNARRSRGAVAMAARAAGTHLRFAIAQRERRAARAIRRAVRLARARRAAASRATSFRCSAITTSRTRSPRRSR